MQRIRSAAPVLRSALGLFAAMFLLPGLSAAGGPPPACLAVIAPANGATLPPGKVLVIGTAKGEGVSRVEIDVNGKGRTAAQVTNGGFHAVLPLSGGRNLIRVSAGKSAVSVSVSGEAKGGYRYHEEVEKCASCHEKGVYGVRGPKDALCYRCHDRQDTGRIIHGPLGGGECTACHDPHGSGSEALTVARAETLCVSCHDQESSKEHLRKSRGRQCTECHNPHSSEKPFLQR